MKLQLEYTDVLLGLLEETDQQINVMIIESLEYVHKIRRIMPNADITLVVKDVTAVDKSEYDKYKVHWLQGDYLSQILPVESESIDVIMGDELFLRSDLMMESVLALCSYLSETGYLVSSFNNALCWNNVVYSLGGRVPDSIDRLFTNADILELLHKSYFYDVNFTPVSDCTDEGKSNIKRLLSMGNEISSDVLAVKKWCVKAAKFKPEDMVFKRRYSKKVRWELVTRLRRVEHGIEALENTIAIQHLMEKAEMSIGDFSLYVLIHVNHIGEFIGNFAPGFYKTGRADIFRVLLGVMVEVYRDHANLDTVVEWKECIDALDEYPEELLPASQPKALNKCNEYNIASENKVAFIACVNSDEWQREWQLYINNLVVPEGMGIELIPVRGAKSICQGYNMGMRQTDAKYKVYLHQDVLIANKTIIEDILKVFADDTIGALGVVGAQTLPSNGVWWDADDRVGRAVEVNDPERLFKYDYPPFSGECIDVQAVDGILIATQVDIEWREDLFTGWHFYDVSQCQEMMRHGYRVVVPKQNDYWVIHCSSPKLLDYSYDEYKAVFVGEYIK